MCTLEQQHIWEFVPTLYFCFVLVWFWEGFYLFFWRERQAHLFTLNAALGLSLYLPCACLVPVFLFCYSPLTSSSTSQRGPSDILTFPNVENEWERIVCWASCDLNTPVVARCSCRCLISWSSPRCWLINSTFCTPLRGWWFLVVGVGWLNKAWCWERTVGGSSGGKSYELLYILLWSTAVPSKLSVVTHR